MEKVLPKLEWTDLRDPQQFSGLINLLQVRARVLGCSCSATVFAGAGISTP